MEPKEFIIRPTGKDVLAIFDELGLLMRDQIKSGCCCPQCWPEVGRAVLATAVNPSRDNLKWLIETLAKEIPKLGYTLDYPDIDGVPCVRIRSIEDPIQKAILGGPVGIC